MLTIYSKNTRWEVLFLFSGVYSFELQNGHNLYEWWVRIHKVSESLSINCIIQIVKFDEDSPLSSDLVTLKQQHNQDHILFHFVFNENFPHDPPFVRVVSPTVRFFFPMLFFSNL